MVKIIIRTWIERDLHVPGERKRLKTSSMGTVGRGSSIRRRISAACSALSRNGL
jgi:hypothetical protein